MAEPRYKDFEDLRDRCPAEIKAEIAVDFGHDDPARLDALWPTTTDGGFRLSLTSMVAEYWEGAVRAAAETAGRPVADDHFAIEIEVDSYADPEMGHTLLLDLRAYCGTERVGELCWDTFDTAALETQFCRDLPARIVARLAEDTDTVGLRCEVEITEVAEA
jgi:hypothetical protein